MKNINFTKSVLLEYGAISVILGISHIIFTELYPDFSLPLLVFLIIEILLFITCYKYFSKSFSWLVLTIPFEVLYLSPSSFPFNIRPYQLLSLNIAIVYLIKNRKNVAVYIKNIFQKRPVCAQHWIFCQYVLLTLLIGIHVLSLRTGIEPTLIIKYTIIIVNFMLLAAVTNLSIKNTKKLTQYLNILLIGSIFPMVLAIFQNIDAIYQINIFSGKWVGRPKGTLAEAAWLGMFLSFIGTWIIHKHYYFKNKWHWFPFLLLFFMTCTITVSRSNWLAMILIIVLTNAWYLKGKLRHKEKIQNWLKKSVLLLLTILISGSLVHTLNLTQFNVPSRFLSMITLKETYVIDGEKVQINEINIKNRKEALWENWKLFKQHPIFGTGFGSITMLKKPGDNESSIYFQILLSVGTVGFLIACFLLYRIISSIWKNYQKTKNNILKYLTILLIIILVTNVFEAGMFLAIFWFLLAILINNSYHENKNTIY